MKIACWNRTIFGNCFGDIPMWAENILSNCFLLKQAVEARISTVMFPRVVFISSIDCFILCWSIEIMCLFSSDVKNISTISTRFLNVTASVSSSSKCEMEYFVNAVNCNDLVLKLINWDLQKMTQAIWLKGYWKHRKSIRY